MEHLSLATDQEERELKRIGRQVARALEPSDGRALAAARRKLFEPKEERSTTNRWIFGFAGLAAAAAIVFAFRSEPGPTSSAAARGSADKAASVASDTVRAADGAKAHEARGPGGAHELVLEQGEARGRLGEGAGMASVVAGPYRISGTARIVVAWSETAGLELAVSEGEARVMAPGMTPVIVSAGTSKTLPAKP